MCNQLPSGSISTASQILGLLVSLADSERSPARQPSGASVKPNRCQEWEILWHGALHVSFIRDIILVLSFWQTFWTPSDTEREHLSDATMPYINRENIYYKGNQVCYILIVKMKKGKPNKGSFSCFYSLRLSLVQTPIPQTLGHCVKHK